MGNVATVHIDRLQKSLNWKHLKPFNVDFQHSVSGPNSKTCFNNVLFLNHDHDLKYQECYPLCAGEKCSVCNCDKVIKTNFICQNTTQSSWEHPSIKSTDTFLVISKKNTISSLQTLSLRIDQKTEDLDCVGPCYPNECVSGLCNGDLKFCEYFQCTNSTECKCTIKQPSFSINQGDQRISPSCLIELPFIKSRKGREAATSQTKTNQYCDKSGVHIEIISGKVDFIKLQIGPKTWIENASLVTTFRIESEFLQSLDEALLKTYNHGSPNPSSSVTFKCHEECPDLDCILCYEFIRNYPCLSLVQKSLYIFETFLSIIFTYFILGAIYRVIKLFLIFRIILQYVILFTRKFCSILMFPKKYLFKSSSKRYDTTVLKRDLPDHTTKTVKQESPKIIKDSHYVAMNELKIKRMTGPRGFSLTIPLILLLSLIQSVSTCSNTIISHNDLSKSFDATMMMSPISQTSCLILKDQKGLNSVLSVETLSTKLHCEPTVSYFTFDSKMSCFSLQHCYQVGDCSGDDPCFTFVSEFRKNTSTLEDLRCSRPPGCITNGCFFCEPSCLTTKISVENPSELVYVVKTCKSWSLSLEAKFTISKKSGVTETETKEFKAGEIIEFNNFRLLAESILMVPIQSDLCFLEQLGSGTSFQECNSPGSLTQGVVGEIQCQSALSARKANSDCKFNFDLVSLIVDSKRTHCSVKSIDLERMHFKRLLPQVYENQIISIKNGVIEREVSIETEINLHIKSESLIVEDLVLSNNCFIRFISLTGCYSCSSGALLEVEVSSDKSVENGIIHCLSFSAPVPISQIKTKQKIKIRVDKYLKTESCSLECSGGNSSLIIDGDLKEPSINIDSSKSYIFGNAGVNSESSSFSFLSKVFPSMLYYSFIPLLVFFLILLLIIRLFSFSTKMIKTV